MRRFFLILMIGFSLLFAGCSYQADTKKQDEKIVEDKPEIQEDKPMGRIHAMLETFEFEEAVAQADLVAQIEILDVLKEIDEPSPATIFRAAVKESLKGSSPTEEIFVMQQGNSDFTFNDNFLFKQGENYLLFLMETIDFDVENSYWILGEESGMYKLIDESTAVKLAFKDDSLKKIEISVENNASLSQKNTELSMNEREMQFVKQDELKNLIKNISGERK